MFHNLLQVITGSPPLESRCHFVEEVRLVEHVPVRNRAVERLLLGCWLAIAGKCGAVVWLVDKYHMPFDPLWVNAPTVACALLCTGLYFWHD